MTETDGRWRHASSDRDLCQFCRRTAALLAQQAARLVGAA